MISCYFNSLKSQDKNKLDYATTILNIKWHNEFDSIHK